MINSVAKKDIENASVATICVDLFPDFPHFCFLSRVGMWDIVVLQISATD